MKSWYDNKFVKFEIIKQILHKEVAILGDKRVRCIFVKNLYELETNLNNFKISNSKNNLYFSLANYKPQKFFSFNPAIRKQRQIKFNKIADNEIISYDIGFDFDNHDGDNFEICKEQAITLINQFDKYKVSYSVNSSGSGFHIFIRHCKLPTKIIKEKDILYKMELIKKLVSDIAIILDLTTLDCGRDLNNNPDGNFYSTRRIWKIPYSLDYKTNTIALPLTSEQLINCKYKQFTPDYVLNNIKIYKRGLLEREGDSENFNKLCEDLLGWEMGL